MSLFTDFLADESAERVMLVELVHSAGTERIADRTYTTSPTDNPANVIYQSRLLSGGQVHEELSGPMNFEGGAFNASDLVIDNGDGALDGWYDLVWERAFIYLVDYRWDLATIQINGRRWEGRIDNIDGDDRVIRISLDDLYADLRQPCQSLINTYYGSLGKPRPLCYGLVGNVPPQIRDQDNTPTYQIHEVGPCRDVCLRLRVNQDTNLISRTKHNAIAVFDINANPGGAVTVDADGYLFTPAFGHRVPNLVLANLLTRTHHTLMGFLRGATATTMQLGTEASPNDGEYNGLRVRVNPLDDFAGDGGQIRTVSSYDGPTRTCTVAAAYNPVPQVGWGYAFDQAHPFTDEVPEAIQAGALTPPQLDPVAFTAPGTLSGRAIGLWIDHNESYVEMLNYVVGKAGYHNWRSDGLFTAGYLPVPESTAEALTLDGSQGDIRGGADGIEIVDVQHPVYSLRVGYDRNHTLSNQGIAGGGNISPAEAAYATREYLWWVREDMSIRQADPAARKVEIGTPFLTLEAAEEEGDRLWTMYSVKRRLLRVRAYTEPMGVDLASVIRVVDPRFGLSAGRNFLLMARDQDLQRGETELLLWG